jgi:hypothetical protein
MSVKAVYRTNDGILERQCTGCGQFKPLNADYFHRNHCKTSGLNSRCKTCQRSVCQRLTAERNAMRKADSAALFLTNLWRTGKRHRTA